MEQVSNEDHIYASVKVLEERSKNILEKVTELAELQKIANGRTTALEQWRSKQKGYWQAVSIIGTIFGAAIGLLTAVILR